MIPRSWAFSRVQQFSPRPCVPPGFFGSFSLKDVLPALVPKLGYADLEIQGGSSASAALERLLIDSGELSTADRQALRRDLLRYCERDTLAMVRLYEWLDELARRK